MSSQQYIQLGTLQEQEILSKTKSQYDGLILKATLINNFPLGCCSFLQQSKKPFFIDPVTYVFNIDTKFLLDSDEENIRQVFLDLAEIYSPEFSSVLKTGKTIDVGALDVDKIQNITENVMRFQDNCFEGVVKDDFFNNLLGICPKVEFNVAPYFFITKDNINEVLPLNIRFTEVAETIKKNIGTFIPITPEILDNSGMLDVVINSYMGTSAKYFVVWIDGLDETKISSTQLNGVISLFSALSSKGRVLNYYGGYLSVLLTKIGLNTVAHGPGYSETRGYLPVKGMTPTPMFYFLALHKRYKIDDLLELCNQIDKETFIKLCGNSPIVSQLLSRSDTVTSAMMAFAEVAKRVVFKVRDRSGGMRESVRVIYKRKSHTLAKIHFLINKRNEFDGVQHSSWGQIIEKLQQDKEVLSGYKFDIRLIDKWLELITLIKS